MTVRKAQPEPTAIHESPADTAAKMQKLRRAVDRLRNLRGMPTSPQKRASWVERLKLRMGLVSEDDGAVGEE
jgi:hypothetical protein